MVLMRYVIGHQIQNLVLHDNDLCASFFILFCRKQEVQKIYKSIEETDGHMTR